MLLNSVFSVSMAPTVFRLSLTTKEKFTILDQLKANLRINDILKQTIKLNSRREKIKWTTDMRTFFVGPEEVLISVLNCKYRVFKKSRQGAD